LVVALSLISPPEAAHSQKEWIVDQSVPAYNDLRKAILAARDGDTILIKSGTYTDNILLEKRLDIFGEPGVKLGVVEVSAGDITLESFASDEIRIGLGGDNIKMNQIDSRSISINSVNNIELLDVNAKTIMLNNVTGIGVKNFAGSVSGSLIQKLRISDSSMNYNLNAANDISFLNVIGSGTIAGSEINVLSVSGNLRVSGSDIAIEYSDLDGLDLQSEKSSVVSNNQFTGAVSIRGSEVTFSHNDLKHFKLDAAVSNSHFHNNVFDNKLSSIVGVSGASSPDINIQQGSVPGPINFMNNSIGTYRGVLVASCETSVKNNDLFLTNIPNAMYKDWKQAQDAGQMAGLRVMGSCEEVRGNLISLNRIHGFETGVAIDSNNNEFTVNEVESNATNIRVSGSNNLVIRNNFLGNSTALDSGAGNDWYVDIDFSIGEGAAGGGGNYWERWEEEDVDHDGIIDTPFALEGNGDNAIDRLPLESPVELVQEETVVPEFGVLVWLVLIVAISSIIAVNSLRQRKVLLD
jgi:predicted secreted protein with PEFG-CTERM motif